MMGLTIAQEHLKRATRDLIDSLGGGERAARLCRVRQQDLSDYGSRNQVARFIPADVVRDLEQCAPAPLVTEALAIEAGLQVFRLPPAQTGAGDWHAMLARYGRESGDVVAKVAAHALDGMTAREVRECNLIGEIDEAIAVLVNMRAVAAAIANEG